MASRSLYTWEMVGSMKLSRIICVDFDGTILTHEYPFLGSQVPLAIQTLKELQANGHRLILFTMRSGQTLIEAVEYLKSEGIDLYGINNNPTQCAWTQSPKAYGHYYIDDAAVGCPLITGVHERPFVSWEKIRVLLKDLLEE
jgi:hypothetical protein